MAWLGNSRVFPTLGHYQRDSAGIAPAGSQSREGFVFYAAPASFPANKYGPKYRPV